MRPCLTPTPATSTAWWPAARTAQPAWERMPPIQCAGHIRAVAAKLREHKTRLARRIEWARRVEGEILSGHPGEAIYLHRRATDVVAGILRWNFPFFLIARKTAPALVTGNTIVIKSSEETPLNAFDFTELLAECDLPKGAFNLVTADARAAGCCGHTRTWR